MKRNTYCLNLLLDFVGDVSRRDLLKERALRAREMTTEFSLPSDDLVNGNGIELRGG